MQLSHTRPVAAARFDDPNLVSYAGLVPIMALAEQSGQPAWTLPGDTATLSLFELQERRLDVLRRLWNATQPREGGKTGGEGSRLGDLFPPDRYNVHEECRGVTVNGYPTLHHDAPFYYQF
ncbi:MAG TPA: hypothetical protein VN888_17255, partial [Mycobacterium sp.]|nr:hypothetical protein [Mycobacterium sp.]